jgi:hypothetical protein
MSKDKTKVPGAMARAEKLSPEERSDIAKNAAAARWNTPKASHFGAIAVGNVEIPCFVLEDGRRVISGRGLTAAIGMKGRGQGVARISAHRLINTNENKDLVSAIENPIKFVGRSQHGMVAASDGYEAVVLQEVCEALLTARDQGRIITEQETRYVQFADMLIRAFAKVGIISLVDEATGYQEVRDKKALQAILDRYLAKELAAWAKRFPDEFYREMFRLKGWPFNPLSVSRPGVVGRYTIDLVYERLAPGLVAELENLNPKDEGKNRKSRHHQWLSSEVGHPALAQHLHAVIGLMRACDSWDNFMVLVDRAFTKKGHTIPMQFE